MAKEIFTIIGSYFASNPVYIIFMLIGWVAVSYIRFKLRELDGYIRRIERQLNSETEDREKADISIRTETKDGLKEERIFRHETVLRHDEEIKELMKKVERLDERTSK